MRENKHCSTKNYSHGCYTVLTVGTLRKSLSTPRQIPRPLWAENPNRLELHWKLEQNNDRQTIKQ